MYKIAILSSFLFSFVNVCGGSISAYADKSIEAISLPRIDQTAVSKAHPETNVGCNAGWGDCSIHKTQAPKD